MSIVLPALAVAFAAICIWLAVRFVNQLDHWTKGRTMAVVIGLPILYLVGFGPVCWMDERTAERLSDSLVSRGYGFALMRSVYRPLLEWVANSRPGSDLILWYAEAGIASDARPGITYCPTADGREEVSHLSWTNDVAGATDGAAN